MIRCTWAKSDILITYHDQEWGTPLHHDRRLFELLILEGMQAGLSWETVLRKREAFRQAFDQFDAEKMARYRQAKIQRLLNDQSIIRNRLKISAAISNAKAYLQVRTEYGRFDTYIWQFVDGQPIQNRWKHLKEIPCDSKESEAMSRDLKQRGFRFVGPTICYAFMQASGMVNDHTINCFKYK